MLVDTTERGVAVIADDDEFFRVALRTLLRDKLKFSEVLEAGSFDEAIELLSERQDVITFAAFDLGMPGIGNWVGLRTVRESFPHILVSVVSASRSRSDILMALDAGVHGYVPKGLGVVELGDALNAICHGMIYVPPTLADREVGEEEPVRDARASDPGEDGVQITSDRQRQVLQLLVEGKSNKEMARTLDLSAGAIKFHLSLLFRRLGVNNRTQAAAVGARFLANRD